MPVPTKAPNASQSSRGRAHRSPTTHAFVPGVGYIEFASPPVANPGSAPAHLANPPKGTPDGSYHFLIVPGGGRRLVFRWTSGHAWSRAGGKRLAFTADYLSRAGWVYQGSATGPDDK